MDPTAPADLYTLQNCSNGWTQRRAVRRYYTTVHGRSKQAAEAAVFADHGYAAQSGALLKDAANRMAIAYVRYDSRRTYPALVGPAVEFHAPPVQEWHRDPGQDPLPSPPVPPATPSQEDPEARWKWEVHQSLQFLAEKREGRDLLAAYLGRWAASEPGDLLEVLRDFVAPGWVVERPTRDRSGEWKVVNHTVYPHARLTPFVGHGESAMQALEDLLDTIARLRLRRVFGWDIGLAYPLPRPIPLRLRDLTYLEPIDVYASPGMARPWLRSVVDLHLLTGEADAAVWRIMSAVTAMHPDAETMGPPSGSGRGIQERRDAVLGTRAWRDFLFTLCDVLGPGGACDFFTICASERLWRPVGRVRRSR